LLQHIISTDDVAMAAACDELVSTELDVNEIKSVITDFWMKNCFWMPKRLSRAQH